MPLLWLDYLVNGFGNCTYDTPTEIGLSWLDIDLAANK